MFDKVDFSELLGKTCVSVRRDCDSVVFDCGDSEYILNHVYKCGESVTLEDVVGGWDNIIKNPILLAKENSSYNSELKDNSYYYKWTLHTLETNKGSLAMLWYGKSQYYPNVDVNLYKIR